LAAHRVWDAVVGGSSPPTPTNNEKPPGSVSAVSWVDILDEADGKQMKKFDGVIEAVRYSMDGLIDEVRVYERRGATWSDRIMLDRKKLVEQIKTGRRFMVGQRKPYLASTFELGQSIRLESTQGREFILAGEKNSTPNRDLLNGAPLF
jgi:hypothetical protein